MNQHARVLTSRFTDIFLNASSEKCVSLANETSKDPVLITLKHMIIKGWLKQKDNGCPDNLKSFLELSMMNCLS